MTRWTITTIVTIAMLASTSLATTWTVAKDGSGDFTLIQDAVDAAADGDVIEIGPGRYDDFTSNEYDVWRIALIEDKSLTFIGAGADETILGPEEFGDIDSHYVYCIIVHGEGLTTRIRDLTCENVQRWGVRIENEGRAEIDDCVFRTSSAGIFGVLRDGGWIRNCEFIDNYTNYQYTNILLYAPSVGVTVENCLFDNCTKGVGSYWPGCQDITIRECTFLSGETGVGFTDGASGAIVDCEFTGQSRYGIVGNSPGTVYIEGNVVDETGVDGLCFCAFYPPGDYILRDNIFSSDAALFGLFTPQIDWDCRDNHFLRTGPEAWYIRPANSTNYHGPPIYLDFTLNWWGTDDPDVVSTWIYDGYDDPEHHYFIDFLPMLNGSVAVESHTWSSVKGLFRD